MEPNPVVVNPEAVKYYRRRAGLTQEKLAAMVHLNPTTLSKIERGTTRSPEYDTVLRVATACGVTVEDLRRPPPIDADKSGVLDDRPNSPTSAPRKSGSYTEAGESGKDEVAQLMQELSDPEVVVLALNSDGVPKRISPENLRVIAEALRQFDAEGTGGNVEKG